MQISPSEQQIQRTFAHIGYTNCDELEVEEEDNQGIDPPMVEENIFI